MSPFAGILCKKKENGFKTHPRVFVIDSLPFATVLLVMFVAGGSRLGAQGVPSVRQDQFRSQWVAPQVDLTSSGEGFPPLNSLGAAVGSLQTPDQIQRENEIVESGLNAPPPFTFHPSLSIGWQASYQGNQSGTNSSSSSNQSSGFIAPSAVLGYNRDLGPWTLSAGYSAGYKYNVNPNYTGSGTGIAQNPISQTVTANAVLEMSRYHVDVLASGSSGSGFDVTSGSYNLQTSGSAALGAKYVLSSSTSLAAHAGYSVQNASGSTATPNNTTSSSFADFSDIYELTDKTHLSLIASAGNSSQGLRQGTAPAGSAPLSASQNAARTYGQALFRVDYTFSPKFIFNAGVGVRYVSSTLSSSLYTGLAPAWTLGVGYTPTEKTSLTFSSGLQAADVVPELNLALSWTPREKTQVSIGVSQTEQFANSLSGEYVVSRGISASVSERLFHSVSLTFNGGYASQSFINLSSESVSGQSSSQLPSTYYYGSLSVFWQIRDWASLVNTVTCSTSQQQNGNGSNSGPQYLYSISMNFSL